MKSKGNIIWIIIFFSLNLTYCGGDEHFKNMDPITPRAEYTADAPDIWEPIKNSHVPIIAFSSKDPTIVKIKLDSFKWKSDHYIEKIGILDENKKVVSEKIFPKIKVLDLSADFPLPIDWKSRNYKVFIRCSLHDMWTALLKESLTVPGKEK